MSLKDPNDEYDEILPEGNNFFSKFLKKNKLIILFLLVGILLGVLIQYSVVDPIIAQNTGNTSKDCTYVKDLLNQENDCLYTLLPDPKLASEKCATQAFVEKNNTPAKDFNEEATN